jgi:hypothetical protein
LISANKYVGLDYNNMEIGKLELSYTSTRLDKTHLTKLDSEQAADDPRRTNASAFAARKLTHKRPSHHILTLNCFTNFNSPHPICFSLP